MEKVTQVQGSDHLQGKQLKSGERLRVKWPDGTEQGMHIGTDGGRAYVVVAYRGVQILIYLGAEGLEAERD